MTSLFSLLTPAFSPPMSTVFNFTFVPWFRSVAPYIHKFRHQTFVVGITGEAIAAGKLQGIEQDLALIQAMGVKLVLVHGARPQIDENLIENNIETPFYNDLRITTREALRCVLDAVGSIRLEIEALLSMGLANSPMYGSRIDAVSGNFVTARPYGVRDGVDFQLTGEVRSVDVEALQKNLQNDNIIVLGPTGYSTTGEVFNLLAEQVAVKTAVALQADKLIFLGEKEGISDEDDRLLRQLIPNEVDQYLRNKPLDSELLLHMAGATEACRGGVRRVHIISYARDGALLQELFTRDGSGTLVSNDSYEEIRIADIDDVVGLIELLRPLEEEGILVYRSRERLETEIDKFAVIERDGMIVGCAAMYAIPTTPGEVSSAEIACVAVHPSYRNGNRGAELLDYLEIKARSKGIKDLFVLTTRTELWFIEQGFEQVPVESLPNARQALYNYQRNSKIFKKSL
jgi:amino-acid N-acetyltransferase